MALGLRLRPDERPRGYDSDAFDAAFAAAFLSPDHPISLISSESLAGARRGPLETLRDACAEAAPIRIVAFVRDLYPQAHASWMQRIKRAAYAHDFPTYCRTFYDNPQVRSLRLYRKVFGAERISVIHYDNMEEDLLAALGGAMGVDLSDLPPCTRVNRSLTGAEARGMMSLNRLHGSPVLSKAATDRLLMRHPGRATGLAWSPAAAELLTERFGAEVEWVNQHFFAGRPGVAVAPPSAPEPVADVPPVRLCWDLARAFVPAWIAHGAPRKL